MKKYNYFIAFFVFLIGLFFISANIVSAQAVGIGVSPVKIEDIVNPGEIVKETITVKNNSDTAKTLYIYLKDFKADGESGQPKLIVPGTEEGYYLASWIDITNEGIDFLPREEKDITFKINVPAETGPGGYYGAIYFGTKPPQLNIEGEDKGAGMAIGQQTGSLILLQVSGDVIEESLIREFSTDKTFYSTPFEVKFLIRIENLGNVHVKPLGNMVVKNMFGKEIAGIVINESGGNVLPNSIRRFSEIWNGTNGFGKYTAEIGLSYGTSASQGGVGKKSMFSIVTFWIIPWKIIIPAGLSIVFLIALTVLFLKFYKNKAVKRAMQQAGMGHVRYVKKYQGTSPTAHLAMVLIIVFLVLFLLIGGIYLLFFS